MDPLKRKLNNLPSKPGCYLFKDASGTVIYIGKAKVLRNRVRSYFQRGRPEGPKLARLRSRISDVEYIVTDSEMEALILEMNLVKEYRPRYNINLKDDKSFPYIRVTNERYPRIFPTRRIVKDGSRYFGPYTDVGSMRNLLKSLKRIFPVRSCNYDLSAEVVESGKVKLCLDYHIKKCDGPCEGLVGVADYAEMIGQVVDFINGRNSDVVNRLRKRMDHFASVRQFEEAARVRDQIRFIQEFQFKQKVVTGENTDRDIIAVAQAKDDACGVVFKVRDGKILGRQRFPLSGVEDEPLDTVVGAFLKQYYLKTDFVPKEVYIQQVLPDQAAVVTWLTEKRGKGVKLFAPQRGQKARLVQMAAENARLLLDELQLQKMKARDRFQHNVYALQRDLRLKTPPKRIECFDISNIQGSDPVASMVTFVNGKPKKGDYRKFKIRGKDTPDDFAMMAEAVARRYGGSLSASMPMPDLILVDGGKGQLSTALRVLSELSLSHVPLAALAKRLDEVYLPGSGEPQNIPRVSSGLKLLQQIRDEAHRFAISFHRTLRKKRTIQSELDQIAGVGPARRSALLKYFGSVKQIREAGVDEIASVDGIATDVAKRIWEHFHFVKTS